MSAIAPTGLGMFIWQPTKCEGGGWDKIIEKAKGAGLSWLILHEFFSTDVVAKLKAAGFYVAFCFYSVPGAVATKQQVVRAGLARQAGVDAILVDAEEYWEKKPDGTAGWRGPEATEFITALRNEVGPDCWIGDGGAWQLPHVHPEYPDTEFAAVMDAACPERYWTELSTTYTVAITDSEKDWTTYKDVQGYKAVIPLGCCYGTNTSPGGGVRPLQPDDLQDFVTRYPTCALWSWIHMPDWGWTIISSRGK